MIVQNFTKQDILRKSGTADTFTLFSIIYMEYILFIFLFILLLIILGNHKALLKRLDEADKKSTAAEARFKLLMQEIGKLKQPDTQPLPHATPTVVEDNPVTKPIKELIPEPVKEYAHLIPPVVKVPEVKQAVPASVPKPPVPAKPAKPKKPSFMERNPDLEKFIGENLINKIGIAILVIGIGFFVKFAIDQNWINEIGRVAIGIGCGGILIAVANKLRTSFKAFSSVLVGGGLAVFYFTIAIAFQDYHIFSQPVAFAIMVVITGFSVLLSIAYDRQELAILAIVGGFASPFMLSTGEGNYIVLFTYILILNAGMILLAYFKRWNIINIVCFAFTVLLYGGWLQTKVLYPSAYLTIQTTQPAPPYLGALIFATLFYLVFFIMNVLNNVKENKKFIASELMILVSNSFLYFSSGMLVLKYIDGGMYQGLFTALIGMFNFIFAYTLYKSNKADKNLIYLLIGLVLTFVSLAAPIQLHGNYITLFWATEAVLLLWLSQKSNIALIKLASMLVMSLMLVSLVMDWFNVYTGSLEETAILWNKGFVTGMVSVLSLLASILLLKNEQTILLNTLPVKTYKTILSVIGIALIYLVCLLELNFQLDRIPNTFLHILYICLYNFAFALVFGIISLKQGQKVFLIATLLFTGICGLCYAGLYTRTIPELRADYLLTDAIHPFHYYAHYLLSGIALALLWTCYLLIRKRRPMEASETKAYLWLSSFAVLFIMSAEGQNILMSAFYTGGGIEQISRLQNSFFQIAFPLIWGICSFIAMFIGLQKKIKTYRIISLIVFFITLLKLFIFDVTRMSEGGKIAAFISLGILLLIISFMYQKLKKIIIEDDTQNV